MPHHFVVGSMREGKKLLLLLQFASNRLTDGEFWPFHDPLFSAGPSGTENAMSPLGCAANFAITPRTERISLAVEHAVCPVKKPGRGTLRRSQNAS